MTKCNLGRKEIIWLDLHGHGPSLTEVGAGAQVELKQKPLETRAS